MNDLGPGTVETLKREVLPQLRRAPSGPIKSPQKERTTRQGESPMEKVRRFRVKAPSRDWDDKGPDLLRPRLNARQHLATVMGDAGTKYKRCRHTKWDGEGFTEWTDPIGKADVLSLFEKWDGKDGAVFQVGKATEHGFDIEASARAEIVRVPSIPNLNRGALMMWALLLHQFPETDFGGGFVCKEYNGIPGSGWSDHAWKDAIDGTPKSGQGSDNDRRTDWLIRMGQERCHEHEQVIGSQNGRVITAEAPGWERVYRGDSSHLWHNHVSFKMHHGADPNCR